MRMSHIKHKCGAWQYYHMCLPLSGLAVVVQRQSDLLNLSSILSHFPGLTVSRLQSSKQGFFLTSPYNDPKKAEQEMNSLLFSSCFCLLHRISKWKGKWLCDLLDFHFRPVGNKRRTFQRVRRHLISLYIQHNTLHRCLNCPLSAKWKKCNFIHSGYSKPFALSFSLTHA